MQVIENQYRFVGNQVFDVKGMLLFYHPLYFFPHTFNGVGMDFYIVLLF